VLAFFKNRIKFQYPPISSEEKPDEYKRAKEHNEAFMMSRSETVFGHIDTFEKVNTMFEFNLNEF